jgi:hypothetical protein
MKIKYRFHKHKRTIMKLLLKLAACVLVTGAAFLSSCKKEPPSPSGNHRPVANAGPDQTITLPANSVVLDGSGSTDPDNDIVDYIWTNIVGPSTPTMAAGNTAKKEVSNLKRGTYEFELLVIDAGRLHSKDTVRVTVAGATVSNDSITVISGAVTLTPFGRLSEDKSVFPATASDKLVFAGGSTRDANNNYTALATVDIYNFSTNTWSTTKLSEARLGMTVATVGNKILYAGGFNNDKPSSRVDIYDAAANTWTTAELSMPRSNMTVAVAGNKALFAGWEYSGFTNRVDIYDASANSWSTAALSEARTGMSAISVGNKIFFAGGYKNYDGLNEAPYEFSTRVDIYDIVTNTWSTADLGEARSAMSAAVVGNKVFFAGGYSNVNPGGAPLYSNRVDIYDVSTNTWSSTKLSRARANITAATAGNKVLFAGGNVAGSINNTVDIYDASSNSWSLAFLSHENISSTTTLGNKVVFFTGYPDVNHIDIYDASANTWATANLDKSLTSFPIAAANKVFIGGGQVYTVGSHEDVHFTSSVWKLEF